MENKMSSSKFHLSWVEICDQEIPVDYNEIINFDCVDNDPQSCKSLFTPQEMETPPSEGVQESTLSPETKTPPSERIQQKDNSSPKTGTSQHEKWDHQSTFSKKTGAPQKKPPECKCYQLNQVTQQLNDLKKKLQNMNHHLAQERKRRISAEKTCTSYLEEIIHLEHKLRDVSQKNEQEQDGQSRFSGLSRNDLIKKLEEMEEKNSDLEFRLKKENTEKTEGNHINSGKIDNLQRHLAAKEALCEELLNKLSTEEKKGEENSIMIENFKKVEEDMKKKISKLNVMLTKVTEEKRQVERKSNQEQKIFNHQHQEDKFMYETLRKDLNKECRLRLDGQNKCRDLTTDNLNLQEEIQVLKQRNTDLLETMGKKQSDEVEADQRIQKELENLQQQLAERTSLSQVIEQQKNDIQSLKDQLQERNYIHLKQDPEVIRKEATTTSFEAQVGNLMSSENSHQSPDQIDTKVLKPTENIPPAPPQQNKKKSVWSRFKRLIAPARGLRNKHNQVMK